MSEKTIEDVYWLVLGSTCAIMSLLAAVACYMVDKLSGPSPAASGAFAVAAVTFLSVSFACTENGYNRRFWSLLGANIDREPKGEST